MNVSKPQRLGVDPSKIRIIQNLWPSLTVQPIFSDRHSKSREPQRRPACCICQRISQEYKRVVMQICDMTYHDLVVDAVLCKSLLCHKSQGLAVTETRCGWLSCQSCSRGRRGLADIRPCLRGGVFSCSRWWFQNVSNRFVIFVPTWGNDPFWLIFFRWVEMLKPPTSTSWCPQQEKPRLQPEVSVFSHSQRKETRIAEGVEARKIIG